MSGQKQENSVKKDAAYVYAGYFLRYLSVLILVPYYGHVLGPISYGTVLAALSLMGIVWMVANYGFSTTGVRELAAGNNDAQHGRIFGRQLMARLILLPIGAAIGGIGTLVSPTLSENPWFGVIATILGLLAAMNLGWFFQGLRKFKTSIALEALSYPLNILFILLLVKGPQDGLWALIGQLSSWIICSIVSYSVALKQLKTSKIVLCDGIKEIKSASFIFVQSVNSMIMTSGSTYLLSVLSTPEQVGYFGSAERLISLGLSFLGPAGQVLMPTIAHRTAHAPDHVHKLVRKSIMFEVGYGICACIGGGVLAPYVVPLIFGDKFQAAIPLMQIMIFALPFAAFTHAFGLYVLIPQKKEKALAWAVATGNALSLSLIALLTHDLGGTGVAISRVAGEFMTTVALIAIWFWLEKTHSVWHLK